MSWICLLFRMPDLLFHRAAARLVARLVLSVRDVEQDITFLCCPWSNSQKPLDLIHPRTLPLVDESWRSQRSGVTPRLTDRPSVGSYELRREQRDDGG